MSQSNAYPPSQEFKISSSTDRTLARRKPCGAPNGHRKAGEDRNSQVVSRQSKTSYKRASERPPAAVARRNARERRRVHTVNQAFNRLKTYVPTLKQKTKRVSKLKILKAAIDYVYDLQDILADCESEIVEHGLGKSDGRSKLFEQTHNGRCQKAAATEKEKEKEWATAHSPYQYSGSMIAAQIAKTHSDAARRTMSAATAAEEHQIALHQNLPYQYQLPIALAGVGHSHSVGVVGRGVVTVPTIPSTAIASQAVSTNLYGPGHVNFVPCHYCGCAMPNSGYQNNGLCDRCASTFANYGYAGISSVAL